MSNILLALSPTSSAHHQHSSSTNAPVSPPASMLPLATNNAMTRSIDSASSNDQTSNPFDVKIRRPKFPGKF
jgi:hypothetical protein